MAKSAPTPSPTMVHPSNNHFPGTTDLLSTHDMKRDLQSLIKQRNGDTELSRTVGMDSDTDGSIFFPLLLILNPVGLPVRHDGAYGHGSGGRDHSIWHPRPSKRRDDMGMA